MGSALINHTACCVLLFIISLFCELANVTKERKTKLLYMVSISDKNNSNIHSVCCSLEEMERKNKLFMQDTVLYHVIQHITISYLESVQNI